MVDGGDGGELGNYKGVMLCNRPAVGNEKSEQSAHFKSRVQCSDPPGVAPVRKDTGSAEADKEQRRLNAEANHPGHAMHRRNVHFLKELEGKLKHEKAAEAAKQSSEEEKAARLAALAERYRDDVHKMKEDQKDAQVQHLSTKNKRVVPKWVVDKWEARQAEDAKMQTLVDMMVEEEAGVERQREERKQEALAQAEASAAAFAKKMEEDPEGAAREDAALLDFASGLDFSKFIDDLEFKEQLCVLRDRAKRLEKEEALFKEEFVKLLKESEEEDEEEINDDTIGGGNASSSGGAGKNDTVKSEKRVVVNSAHDSASAVAPVEDADAKVAKEAHETLKGIHSKASIEKVVETASNVG